MKIEELFYPMPEESVDPQTFDLNRWRKEHPADYLKAVYLINSASNKDEVFQMLYSVFRLYIPDTLYKYYSLSEDEKLNHQKLQTLANRKIFLSDIKGFNDPFDGKAFYYHEDRLKKYKRLAHCGGRLIDDFTAYHRATSLTANGINSMPMWAHYANNHAGFCVSYNMKDNFVLSSNTFPVQYTDQRIDITDLMDRYVSNLIQKIETQLARGIKKIYGNDMSVLYVSLLLHNLKHISWSYENEFRCAMGATAPGMPYVDAAPKEIFIGMNCREELANQIFAIASDLSVPVHRMGFDEHSPDYNLIIKD